MSPRPLALLCACALCLSASRSSAAVVASDDFSRQWPGSPPIGADAGVGWLGAWRVGPDIFARVAETEAGGDRFVSIEGGNTIRALLRKLATPMPAGEPVYARVVFAVDAPGGDPGEAFAGWTFFDAQGNRPDTHSLVLNFKRSVGARIADKSAIVAERLIPGETHVAIIRIDGWDENRRLYTRTTVWLNPAPDIPEAKQLRQATVNGDGCGAIEGIALRTHNLGDTVWRFSEVRLGTSWADAVSP